MIRKLFIFSGVGLILSLGCLAAATALVSSDLNAHGWNWSMIKDGDHVRFVKGAAAKAEANVNKTLDWAGGDLLAVDVPAEVVYTQGPVTSVTVSGPQALTDRVRIEGGRIFMIGGPDRPEVVNFRLGPDGIDAQSNQGGVKILVTAPSVTRFELAGDGDLSLRGYDQKVLDLNIAGDGSVEATGRTDTLKLRVSGSGDADLSGLQARDAEISVSGSGGSEVAATGNAQVDISGSGNVELTTKPTNVTSHISGSGSLDQD